MLDEKLTDYIRTLYAQDDDVLLEIRQSMAHYELPGINLDPEEGHTLQMLLRMIGARKVIEIGTLAGYSTVWIARSLPEDGTVYTLERDKFRAFIADENLRYAGVIDKTEIMLGEALEKLAELEAEAPFDAVFIDADKTNSATYARWAIDHTRIGGLVIAHNAFRRGTVVDPNAITDPGTRAVREANQLLADDPRVFANIIPIGDGFLVGLRTS